jgi:ParE toxin of type II toxin-antitoxin system, parDE
MRRRFKIVLGPKALTDLSRLREVPGLGAELGKLLLRLEKLPWSAPRDRHHGQWSKTRRKAILGETGYVLRYRLHLRAELIEVFSIRHQKQRPPR